MRWRTGTTTSWGAWKGERCGGVLKWLAQDPVISLSFQEQFDQFCRCQSMSQFLSFQPWEFIASQSPGIAFPDQVASEREGGVLLQGLGYLEASIKA